MYGVKFIKVRAYRNVFTYVLNLFLRNVVSELGDTPVTSSHILWRDYFVLRIDKLYTVYDLFYRN